MESDDDYAITVMSTDNEDVEVDLQAVAPDATVAVLAQADML